MDSGLRQQRLYLESVVTILERAGIAAHAAPLRRPDDPTSGHIVGIEGFELEVTSSVRGKPAQTLARAQEAAAAQNKKYGAAIIARPDQPTGDSFVVLSLADFSALVAERLAA